MRGPFKVAILSIFLLAVVGVLLYIRQATTAEVLVVSGLLQVSDSLQLDVSVSPPVTQPGDSLQLQAILTNLEPTSLSPEVIFHLPPGLVLENQFLPAGMTMNVKANSLHWLPVVAANGGRQQLSLALRVGTADLHEPNREMKTVLRLNGSEESVVTSFWVGIPPQVDVILAPPQVSVGQPFQLRADMSGSGPFTQVWDLGDGRTVKVNDPIVVFPAAGVYTVRLEASNPLATASRTQAIRVVPHPAAQFTMDDLTPGVGQMVTFISQSGGAGPLQYAWDFGDGVGSSEARPVYQYNAPGTYEVHLRVWNEFGESEAYWPVVVGEPPTAEMTVPESVPAGQTWQGLAFGDESVLRFEWAMGDGRYHEGAQIDHMYTQTGDYYITMIAVNDYGGTEVSRWIHVDPGLLRLYLPFIGQEGEGQVVDDVLAGLDLPEVPLDAPFVLEPIAVPPNSTMAEQLFLYINEARRQFDLPPLTNNVALNVAAQNHAGDMAAFGFTAHTGSDGSTPAERLIWHQYGGGYAGEATAWGFEFPYEAVEFWVNSPGHRRIILNRWATEVGVGFTVKYDAPNVWYWTAEFGDAFGQPDAPQLRVQSPAENTEAMVTTPLAFAWNWPVPLAEGQRFVLYLHTTQGAFPVAETGEPYHGIAYQVVLTATNLHSGNHRLQVMPGRYQWSVALEEGGKLVESEPATLTLLLDPNAPTPTPTATPVVTNTAVAPTLTPTLVYPTATPPPPTPTPLPPFATVAPGP